MHELRAILPLEQKDSPSENNGDWQGLRQRLDSRNE